MHKYLKGALVVNEGETKPLNILVEGKRIKQIYENDTVDLPTDTKIIDCGGLILLPGIIDTHVHFRQPGLEYKADMFTESKAAVAGGVTTVLEMPNTKPPTTTLEALQDKLSLAQDNMFCNYSFFYGLTNNNVEQALSVKRSQSCGIKLFLGSSTGNMLVEDTQVLHRLFSSEKEKVISIHCEDESIIRRNTAKYENETEGNLPYDVHSLIRTTEACYKSTSFAISLAERYHTRINIAHISTEKELSLLSSANINDKFITAFVHVVDVLLAEISPVKDKPKIFVSVTICFFQGILQLRDIYNTSWIIFIVQWFFIIPVIGNRIVYDRRTDIFFWMSVFYKINIPCLAVFVC